MNGFLVGVLALSTLVQFLISLSHRLAWQKLVRRFPDRPLAARETVEAIRPRLGSGWNERNWRANLELTEEAFRLETPRLFGFRSRYAPIVVPWAEVESCTQERRTLVPDEVKLTFAGSRKALILGPSLLFGEPDPVEPMVRFWEQSRGRDGA